MPDSPLDPSAELVRRHDPDRFLTALFAPADRRSALFALYAFNHELARAREVASEPTLALIRLQWWREVVEGAPRRHEVATPLSAAIEGGALARDDLLSLIEAREIEAEPSIPSLAVWRDYLLRGAGGLAVAAGRLLGAPEPEALRPLGAAYGVAGVLRSASVLAAQRRCLLPEDVLARHGLVPEAVVLKPHDPLLAAVLRDLAGEGRRLLAEAEPVRLPRSAIAAALPAVLARRDLRRTSLVPRERGLGDRLAVVRAGVTGRLPGFV
jgi:phytoene synthase